MSFKGKTVIITGSSSGIGQDAAVLFGTEGANVTIHGQSAERLKQTVELLKKAGVPESRYLSVLGPIEDEKVQKKIIDETVKKFGHLDVLVNNAGISHRTEQDIKSLETLDYVMNVNVRSLVSITRMAVPHLAKTKGNVVNISSVGSRWALPTFGPYQMSKAAVDHFNRCAAIEYADMGIRVNSVRPGLIDTAFSTRHSDGNAAVDQAKNQWLKACHDNVIPMHRSGTPREISDTIAFLASDKASYITGTDIIVDGGLLCGAPTQK